ncbi:MAG: ABC transporter substrate-binding protein [SAR324 cluster bacterium]|nr:ABC transporter substrate-binding protein [SAR324 cluster bacterium]
MRFKPLLTLFLIVSFAGPLFAADTIKIGDINSYKNLPAHTIPYRNGATLAIEKINASGGVLGKQLELISRDDQGKPAEAIKIAEDLFSREEVSLISGTLFSHIGIALGSYAAKNKKLYIAAEPLADALVWAKGNRYTFRLRPSTYMQAAMLAEEAAKKKDVKTWATIAPNYAYGKDAVSAFKNALKKLRPDVEFVGEQWPALFKINAGAETQALLQMKPQGIYNVTFGSDLAKFVREGTLRNLFKDRLVVGLLTGEPEYIDPLKDEAPEGWLVTGYPWYDIKDSTHQEFVASYRKKFNETPKIGSIVGYNTMMTIEALLKKAQSTDTEKMVEAMKGLDVNTPTGPVHYRAIDHQSTMGAYVGWTTVKNGTGIMVDWKYLDGKNYLPTDAEVRKLRPN